MSAFNATNINRNRQVWTQQENEERFNKMKADLYAIDINMNQKYNALMKNLEEKEKELDWKISDVRGVIEDVMNLIKEFG